MPNLGEVEATASEEVAQMDLENNRWKAALQSRVDKKIFGKSLKVGGKETVEWLPIGELVMASDEGIKLSEYEGVVRVENLGIRTCIIQEYAEGMNTTLVFWDKKLRWPLKYILIFRKRKEDSRSMSKELGRTIQRLCMVGDSQVEINI